MEQHHALGVDIGQDRATVCAYTQPPHILAFTDPAWWEPLAAMIAPGATVLAFEPTGWHYAAPIMTLAHHFGARLLHVEHRISKKVRETRIGKQKSDRTDAEALSLIAWEVGNGVYYAGTHWFDPAVLQLAAQFKFLVRAQIRARGRVTAMTNRLHQYAHSIWPSLDADLTSYTRAIAAGAVTPQELQRLAAALEAGHKPAGYEHGQARRWFNAMFAKLPPFLFTTRFDHLYALLVESVDERQTAQAKLAAIEAHINSLLEHALVREVVALWRTVPAASDTEIAALLAATNCEPQHFTDDAMCQACRCNPVREESGQLVRTRLTEVGNKYAQRALHLWVMRLLAGDKRPNPIAAHFDRLKAQGHRYTMATCRNHLATILAGIARSGKPCNWPLQRSNGHLADAESEQVLSAAATGE